MTARVAWISYAPVKGLGLSSADEVDLEPNGLRENRRFHLIGNDGRLVNGKLAGSLVQVAAAADRDGTALTLRFPDGTTLDGELELGEPVETSFYGRPVAGHVVEGGYADALSAFAGRSLRLVRVDEPGAGNDRGFEGSISAVSTASLEEMARVAGEPEVDPRRFRMLFGIDGVTPNEEDRWAGRRVAFGDAVVRMHGLVGRCAVTTQDPDTGIPDLDTLRIIGNYRGDVETDEPLPFGVWGGVEHPGRVRVGDTVEAL
jgi:uncharacterized protein YcbX